MHGRHYSFRPTAHSCVQFGQLFPIPLATKFHHSGSHLFTSKVGNDYFRDDLQYFDKDLRIWRMEVCRGYIQKDLQYFDEMNVKCPSLCTIHNVVMKDIKPGTEAHCVHSLPTSPDILNVTYFLQNRNLT